MGHRVLEPRNLQTNSSPWILISPMNQFLALLRSLTWKLGQSKESKATFLESPSIYTLFGYAGALNHHQPHGFSTPYCWGGPAEAVL